MAINHLLSSSDVRQRHVWYNYAPKNFPTLLLRYLFPCRNFSYKNITSAFTLSYCPLLLLLPTHSQGW
jgi:hypothetical protein